MSAAVEACHPNHFSPLPDTMARPGSGWAHDPYTPRQQSGFHPDQEYSQAPQPPSERLPGPSSLFSSRATSSPSANTPVGPAPAHQHPTSPRGREVPYDGFPRPQYYGADYATPSPITQTPPLLAIPTGDQQQHQYPLAPRRHPDARLSPTQSSTTSDRSDDHPPSDGPTGHGGQVYHPAALSPRGPFIQQQPSAPVPNLGHPMHHPSRSRPHQDDTRHTSAAGALMGKLVPQSYSANGRQPRSAAPPTLTTSTQLPQHIPPPAPPHHLANHLSLHHQPQHSPERQPHQSAYQGAQQQYPAMQARQKYSTSPPPLSAGYQLHHEQQPQLPPPPQQHQSSLSPQQEPVKMSIHSLLSGGGGGRNSTSSVHEGMNAGLTSHSGTASVVTSPSVSSQKAPAMAPPPPATSKYRIKVRQQPVAARSCGFGERDRRVIDPPPIVQLFFDDPNASPDDLAAKLRHPYSVVHCSIWNETGEEDNSAMPEDYRQQRRLMGTLVASPFVGKDDANDEGCFFCFPDLSCRTPGNFRLKFSLVIISPKSMQLGSKAPILATAMSEVFTVYNAKDFPGMQASTTLTKRLKEQGCLISIKKGNEKASGGSGSMRDRGDSEDDDEDDGGGGGSSSGPLRRKRPRKT